MFVVFVPDAVITLAPDEVEKVTALILDKKEICQLLEKVVELDPYNVRAKDALDRLIKKKFKDGKPKKGLFSRKQ